MGEHRRLGGRAAVRSVQGSENVSPRSSDVPIPIAPWPSATLLQGRDVVQIEHNGAVYQLRSTRLGKLILTK